MISHMTHHMTSVSDNIIFLDYLIMTSSSVSLLSRSRASLQSKFAAKQIKTHANSFATHNRSIVNITLTIRDYSSA